MNSVLSPFRVLTLVASLATSCSPQFGKESQVLVRSPVDSKSRPLAYIIANDKYHSQTAHKSIGKQDWRLLKYNLEVYGGYEVVVKENVEYKAGFERNIQVDLPKLAEGRSHFVLFYTGHGYGAENKDIHEDYLIPTRANLGKFRDGELSSSKIIDECVSTRWIINTLKNSLSAGQDCIVHFNACRGSQRSGVTGAQAIPRVEGRMAVAYATTPSRVANAGSEESDGTVYSNAFSRAISGALSTKAMENFDPTARDYYHHLSFQRVVATENDQYGQQCEYYPGSFSAINVLYSPNYITWSQYKSWREESVGDLKGTTTRLTRVVSLFENKISNIMPEDSFGDKALAIHGCKLVYLDRILEKLISMGVQAQIPNGDGVDMQFIQSLKVATDYPKVSDPDFLVWCDLVVPGLKNHVYHREKLKEVAGVKVIADNSLVQHQSNSDSQLAAADKIGP